MRRIVVIAASMAGIACATRIKRGSQESEVNIVIPAALEKFQTTCKAAPEKLGPAARRLAKALPDTVLLPTRRVGVLEAEDIMPDLKEKEVTVTSSRGRVTIRYSDLVLEVPATVRLPRALQKARNVFGWPLSGFSARPEDCDLALSECAGQGTAAVVVGKGVAALDALFLALEAGTNVHWLYTAEKGTPDIDPLLLEQALKKLGSRVQRSILPDLPPERLNCRLSADGLALEALTLPDGSTVSSPCILWTSPLMARHPILREEGVCLDAYGRIQVEESHTDTGLHIIGSGSAVAPASLPKSGLQPPEYPGGEENAQLSAALCALRFRGNTSSEDTDPGTLGVACAGTDGICFRREGYSMTEAAEEGLEAEYAVTSLLDDTTAKPVLLLSLVCSKQSRTLLGAQVLGLDADAGAVDGLFGMALAALADGTSVDTLRSRPRFGLPSRLLGQGASILCNKLDTIINGITPEELLSSHAAGAEFFTIDLRSLPEWQEGHVVKAYSIPLLQLKKRLQDEVPHFTPLVLISEDGTDAYAAACKLAGLGASSLYVLDGGMRLWPYELEKDAS